FSRDWSSDVCSSDLTKFFKVNLEAHHRAIYDAYATAEIFLGMLQNFYKEEIMTYYEINAAIEEEMVWPHPIPYYATILAQNQVRSEERRVGIEYTSR